MDSFIEEVFFRGLCGGEEEIRDVVRHHPVDLLGHPAIERAKPGLHVGHRDVQFRCGQRPGEHGVGISLHQHGAWMPLLEDSLHSRQDLPGLLAVRTGPDVDIDLRRGELKLLEEDPVHLVGVVLPGVEGEEGDVPGDAFPDDRGHLDDLGPGAEDDGEHT